MKETYGVPVEEIQEAIKHGVRKINIDTDIRLAMTAAIRKYRFENPDKFDPRDYLKPAREAAKVICRQRYVEFGCEGQAGKIKTDTLQVVAAKYAKGELAQTVNLAPELTAPRSLALPAPGGPAASGPAEPVPPLQICEPHGRWRSLPPR